MKKYNWQALMNWLNARHVRERVILLAGTLGVVVMLWLAFVHDVVTAAKESERRNLLITNSQILEEQTRQAEISGTYTDDPNSFARSRQQELRDATQTANERLDRLYGDLISPQQMSLMLTTLLQRETTLNLLSLGNIASEALIPAAANAEAGAPAGSQVFKHGMRMVFEGSFIETVYYLRSLERLDSNFFWENLEFEMKEYPNAQISLDIYTLSTEKGFIGV